MGQRPYHVPARAGRLACEGRLPELAGERHKKETLK